MCILCLGGIKRTYVEEAIYVAVEGLRKRKYGNINSIKNFFLTLGRDLLLQAMELKG